MIKGQYLERRDSKNAKLSESEILNQSTAVQIKQSDNQNGSAQAEEASLVGCLKPTAPSVG